MNNDKNSKAFFFDRNPEIFKEILKLIINGEFHFLPEVEIIFLFLIRMLSNATGTLNQKAKKLHQKIFLKI